MRGPLAYRNPAASSSVAERKKSPTRRLPDLVKSAPVTRVRKRVAASGPTSAWASHCLQQAIDFVADPARAMMREICQAKTDATQAKPE
jgi:hypothetical protein